MELSSDITELPQDERYFGSVLVRIFPPGGLEVQNAQAESSVDSAAQRVRSAIDKKLRPGTETYLSTCISARPLYVFMITCSCLMTR